MSLVFAPLPPGLDRSGFTCGDRELDSWFHRQAGQDMRRGYSKVIVAHESGGDEIVGFYALSSASIPLKILPLDVVRKLPRHPDVPAVRLGRLAVASTMQGHMIGGRLLLDAMQRALGLDLGWAFIVVDARNERAARFYERFSFLRFPDVRLSLRLSRRQATEIVNRRQQLLHGPAAVPPGTASQSE